MDTTTQNFHSLDGRFTEPENKQYQISHLWEMHKEIIRLLVMSDRGYTNKYIGEQVGCTAQTVSNVRNSPLAREEIAKLSGARDESAKELAQRVREIAPLAIDLLRETMSEAMTDGATDPKLLSQGVRGAIAVIDHAIPKQIKGEILHGHLTLGQINEMKQKVLEEEENKNVI